MRVLAAAVLLATWCGPVPAQAAELYAARTIVTGMDGRSRPGGFRHTLAQVLAKVAGNPALADDKRLDAVDPAPLVRRFAYLDRMSDIPVHDEQGSRDRPFDLVVGFEPGAIDALLRQWGESPWPEPRRPLLVQVEIRPRRGAPLPLLADTAADERHRGALLAAAERFGVEVILPARLESPAAPPDAAVLTGHLQWSDQAAGWVGEWSLGGTQWGVTGVSFDAAYRDAIGGSARLLSRAR